MWFMFMFFTSNSRIRNQNLACFAINFVLIKVNEALRMMHIVKADKGKIYAFAHSQIM